jgi:hypothetical protein
MNSKKSNRFPPRCVNVPLAGAEAAAKVLAALCQVVAVEGRRTQALAHYAAPLPGNFF